MLCDPRYRQKMKERGDDPEKLGALYGDLINTAMSDIPPDMRITMHLCRGNYKSTFMGSGGYEAEQEILFDRIKVHGYFMEYDSERAGGFEPLRLVPKDRQVVLGLVTTKTGRLESKDVIKRRIEEAAKYISLDQLCLSPQCGFASTEEGNLLAEEEQWAKLRDDRGIGGRGVGLVMLRVPGAARHEMTRCRPGTALVRGGPGSAAHRYAYASRCTASGTRGLVATAHPANVPRQNMPGSTCPSTTKSSSPSTSRRSSTLRPQGRDALRARPRLRPGPDERGRTRLRLREKSQSAADLRPGAGLHALLAAPAGDRRDLDPCGAWRAGLDAAQAGRAARHRGRQDAHSRRDRQGRGHGRAGVLRAPHHRQAKRRPAGGAEADHLLPRRRRLRRPDAMPRRRRIRSPSARRTWPAICRRGRKWR